MHTKIIREKSRILADKTKSASLKIVWQKTSFVALFILLFIIFIGGENMMLWNVPIAYCLCSICGLICEWQGWKKYKQSLNKGSVSESFAPFQVLWRSSGPWTETFPSALTIWLSFKNVGHDLSPLLNTCCKLKISKEEKGLP